MDSHVNESSSSCGSPTHRNTENFLNSLLSIIRTENVYFNTLNAQFCSFAFLLRIKCCPNFHHSCLS